MQKKLSTSQIHSSSLLFNILFIFSILLKVYSQNSFFASSVILKNLLYVFTLISDFISSGKPSIELLTKIKIKINNNRVTNKEFASDININRLEEMIKEELTEQKKKN